MTPYYLIFSLNPSIFIVTYVRIDLQCCDGEIGQKNAQEGVIPLLAQVNIGDFNLRCIGPQDQIVPLQV